MFEMLDVITEKCHKQTPILPDDTLCGVMLICGAVAAVVANLKLDRQRANAERSENTPRDRTRVKLKILSMNPATFKRNYRLDRVSFMDLLSKITPDLAPQPNQVCDDANMDPVIQLVIMLRMLAGGSYLDIAFGYDVGLSSVYAIFKKVLVAIDNNVDNIQFV